MHGRSRPLRHRQLTATGNSVATGGISPRWRNLDRPRASRSGYGFVGLAGFLHRLRALGGLTTGRWSGYALHPTAGKEICRVELPIPGAMIVRFLYNLCSNCPKGALLSAACGASAPCNCALTSVKRVRRRSETQLCLAPADSKPC